MLVEKSFFKVCPLANCSQMYLFFIFFKILSNSSITTKMFILPLLSFITFVINIDQLQRLLQQLDLLREGHNNYKNGK